MNRIAILADGIRELDGKLGQLCCEYPSVEKLGIDSPKAILGKNLESTGAGFKARIVGVVKNFHDRNFTQGINPAFIVANPNWYGEIALKINGQNIKNTLDQIDAVWSGTFKDHIYEYQFLDERVAKQYETEQRYLSLSKIFAALAIFIGCLGLYGLILFFVGQRKKEIGIRKVLGSSIGDVLALFSIDFLKLVVIAGVIATPLAWYVMNEWLQGYAYKTQIHWWYFAIAVFAIMFITLATISYQTIRVATNSPVKSLRTE